MEKQKLNHGNSGLITFEGTVKDKEVTEAYSTKSTRNRIPANRVVDTEVAVFIDLDNFLIPLHEQDEDGIAEKLTEVLRIAWDRGNDVELQAYGDFSKQPFWLGKLLETKGIRMIHAPALNGNGKSSDDMTMAVDIAQLPFLKPHIKTIVVVSADGHFVPAIKAFSRCNEERKTIVVHTDKVNTVLKKSANECVSLIT